MSGAQLLYHYDTGAVRVQNTVSTLVTIPQCSFKPYRHALWYPQISFSAGQSAFDYL